MQNNNMMRARRIIRDSSVKAVMTGATMAAGSMFLFGQTNNVNVFNMSIPSYVPIAGAGVISSYAGDLAHEFIFPALPQDQKLKNLESAGLNFLSSGVGFCVALKAITGFGGATKLGVDAVYNTYIDDKGTGFIF